MDGVDKLQLYTAGIPLLEAYLLPMAEVAKNVSPKNKMAASTWSRLICMRVFRGVKNGRLIVHPYQQETL